MTAEEELHDRQARAVTHAVVGLLKQFGPQGFTAEAISDGAIRGAAVVMISTGASAENVAEVLEDLADGFRRIEGPHSITAQ